LLISSSREHKRSKELTSGAPCCGVDTEYHCLEISRLGECEFFLISEMNSQMIVHQPYRTLTTLQSELALSQDEVATAWSVVNDHYMTDLPLLYPPHVVALTAILLSLVLRPPGGGGSGGSGSQGGNNGSGGPSIGGGQAHMAAAAAATLAQAQARAALQGGGAQTPGGQPQGQGASGGAAAGKTKEGAKGKLSQFGSMLVDSNVDIEAMVDCTQELLAFYECHEQYNDKHTREQINRFVKARGLDR